MAMSEPEWGVFVTPFEDAEAFGGKHFFIRAANKIEAKFKASAVLHRNNCNAFIADIAPADIFRKRYGIE